MFLMFVCICFSYHGLRVWNPDFVSLAWVTFANQILGEKIFLFSISKSPEKSMFGIRKNLFEDFYVHLPPWNQKIILFYGFAHWNQVFASRYILIFM